MQVSGTRSLIISLYSFLKLFEVSQCVHVCAVCIYTPVPTLCWGRRTRNKIKGNDTITLQQCNSVCWLAVHITSTPAFPPGFQTVMPAWDRVHLTTPYSCCTKAPGLCLLVFLTVYHCSLCLSQNMQVHVYHRNCYNHIKYYSAYLHVELAF